MNRAGKNGRNYRKCPRFWNAIRKYGWHSFACYELVCGLNKQEADEFEINYIRIFNSDSPKHGYNVAPGGQDNGYAEKKRIPVTVFDLRGNRVMDFQSLTSCARYLGITVSTLCGHLKNGRGTVAGHICKPTHIVEGITNLPANLLYAPGEQRMQLKEVDLFTINGEYLRTFRSVKDAASFIGVNASTVSGSLKAGNHHNTCKGFQVRLHSESEGRSIGKAVMPGENNRGHLHYSATSVIQYDPSSCKEVARYGSISEAAHALNCGHTTLLHALNHESPTCKGFIWRRATDDSPVIPVTIAGNPPDNPNRQKRPVWKCDSQTHERLERYDSTADAARAVCVSGSAITVACRGKSKTCRGYCWEYDV